MYLITIAKIDRWGRENKVDKLLESLNHENDEIRKAAALSLGKIGNRDILTKLEHAFESDSNIFVKKDIQSAIQTIQSRRNLDLSKNEVSNDHEIRIDPSNLALHLKLGS